MAAAAGEQRAGAVAALMGASVNQFAAGFGFMAFSLLVPSLARATGLNERDFGLWVTFFFVGTAISSPATGSLVRALGGVGTVALAMFAMAAAVLIILIGTWPATMLAAMLFGLCYGPQGPVGMTVVTERTPPSRRGLFLALRHASQPLAGVIAGRALPPMLLVLGWQSGVLATSALLCAGGLFTLALPALFHIQTPPAPPPARGAIARVLAATAGMLWIPPGLRVLWIAGLVSAVNQVAMIVFSYLYLLEVVKLSPIIAGVFVSNMQLAGLFGRPLLGWLCDRTGRSQFVLAMLSAIGVVTIFALFQFSSPHMPAWQLFLIAIACGISGQAWNAVFTTAMSYKVPADRLAEMNGRSFSFLSFGWLAAAPMFWILIEFSGGYELPFGVVLVANAMAATLLLLNAGTERP